MLAAVSIHTSELKDRYGWEWSRHTHKTRPLFVLHNILLLILGVSQNEAMFS